LPCTHLFLIKVSSWDYTYILVLTVESNYSSLIAENIVPQKYLMPKYAVLEFELEDGKIPIEVTPSCWINKEEGTSYWPLRSGPGVRRYIKEARQPQPDWTVYKYKKILAECGK